MQDKNTSAGLCAINAGGAYARGGAYLWDTTVSLWMLKFPHDKLSVKLIQYQAVYKNVDVESLDMRLICT